MVQKYLLYTVLLLFAFPQNSSCQFNITLPLERSVFQRVNDKGTIQIEGNTGEFIEQLQVRLIVRQGGTALDWLTVNTNIEPGNFRAQIENVNAGWYHLEIRGLNNGNQIAFGEIQRVGIGEVFIVAGQSNAQGGRPPEGGFSSNTFYGAMDDRVNCVNDFFITPNTNYPIPTISNIAAETYIAPKGKASWCWALLGDKISSTWNVPVLFFNVAIGATKCSQWKDAAYGDPVTDHYSNNPNIKITNGWPYADLKKTLEYYTKIFGIRAIIWQQGEDDMAYFDSAPQIFTKYISNLKSIIQKTREHSNQNVSWLIARVSRVGDGLNYNLKLAQKTVAEEANQNTFLGPDTDIIQPGLIYRDSGVHFKSDGLVSLANAWFATINNSNFIANSTPYAGTNNFQIINNQVVFGSSLPPCAGVNQTINSGDWHSANTWSCGTIPTSLNEIIINEGHIITINNKTVYLKNLTLNGSINLENDANILIVE